MNYLSRIKNWFVDRYFQALVYVSSIFLRRNLTVGQSIALQVKFGLIYSNGAPRLCWNCGSRTFHDKDRDYLDGILLLEYSVCCSKCDKTVGHWAYGNWSV